MLERCCVEIEVRPVSSNAMDMLPYRCFSFRLWSMVFVISFKKGFWYDIHATKYCSAVLLVIIICDKRT